MPPKEERLVISIFGIIKSEASGRFAIWISFITGMTMLVLVLAGLPRARQFFSWILLFFG